jgi:hypothetical protein
LAVAPVQAPTRTDYVVSPTLDGEHVVAEHVSLEGTAALRASVGTGIGLAATERALRLHSLAQEVRAGAYHPNPSQLAERILADAELQARLVNMIR